MAFPCSPSLRRGEERGPVPGIHGETWGAYRGETPRWMAALGHLCGLAPLNTISDWGSSYSWDSWVRIGDRHAEICPRIRCSTEFVRCHVVSGKKRAGALRINEIGGRPTKHAMWLVPRGLGAPLRPICRPRRSSSLKEGF